MATNDMFSYDLYNAIGAIGISSADRAGVKINQVIAAHLKSAVSVPEKKYVGFFFFCAITCPQKRAFNVIFMSVHT